MSDEGCFYDFHLPEKFTENVKRRLERMDHFRIGGIYTNEFEDGMRYVYCQILNETKRCNEMVEAYTKMKGLRFDLIHIREDLNRRQHDRLLALRDKNQSAKAISPTDIKSEADAEKAAKEMLGLPK